MKPQRPTIHHLPPEGRSRLLHPHAVEALLLLARGPAGERRSTGSGRSRPIREPDSRRAG